MTFLRTPISSIDLGGAEIVAYQKDGNYAAVITGGSTLAIVSYNDVFNKPKLLAQTDLQGDAQSVAISKQGLIAVAISKNEEHDGLIGFYTLKGDRIRSRGRVEVGNLPDSIDLTADGSILVSANEGEPNTFYGTSDGIDPKGSISIVRIDPDSPGQSKVKTLDFSEYSTEELRGKGLRISGENPVPELDLEPEYATISKNGRRAFVTLQENNGIARVNLKTQKIEAIFTQGAKDWSSVDVDTTDEDEIYSASPKNFQGLRMADGIKSFQDRGKTYIITANEGDGRVRPDSVNFEATLADGTTYSYGTNLLDGALANLEDELTGETIYVYGEANLGNQGNFEADQGDELFITIAYGAVADDDFYNDEVRTGKLTSGDATLIDEGRLKTVKDSNDPVTGLKGFGGRSFSIFTDTGELIYDSANLLDQITNAAGFYDDGRSDDKSIEPESVEVATLGRKRFAFIGLERAYDQSNPDELGTFIPVFNISNPSKPHYVGAFSSEQSLSPEGLKWVGDGARGGHLLVANEVSGTLDAFRFNLNMLG